MYSLRHSIMVSFLPFIWLQRWTIGELVMVSLAFLCESSEFILHKVTKSLYIHNLSRFKVIIEVVKYLFQCIFNKQVHGYAHVTCKHPPHADSVRAPCNPITGEWCKVSASLLICLGMRICVFISLSLSIFLCVWIHTSNGLYTWVLLL